MARITVVNDSPEFLELMDEILEDDRHATTTIDGDRHDAVEAIVGSRPDLLIIDIRLGVEGDHGWEIAKAVRARPEVTGPPVLLCCADPFAVSELADELEMARDVETLPKPFSVLQLTDAVERLLANPSIQRA